MQSKSPEHKPSPRPNVLKDTQEYGIYYLEVFLHRDELEDVSFRNVRVFKEIASILTKKSRTIQLQLFENYLNLYRHVQHAGGWESRSPMFHAVKVLLTKKELQDAYAYRDESRIRQADVILRNPVRFQAHRIISVEESVTRCCFNNPEYSSPLVQENNKVPSRSELPQPANAFTHCVQNVETVKYLSCIDLARLVSVSRYCQNLVDNRLQQGFTVYSVIYISNTQLPSLDFEALRQCVETNTLKKPFTFYTSYQEGRESIPKLYNGTYCPGHVLYSMKAVFPRSYKLLPKTREIEVRCAFPIKSKDIYSYAHIQESKEDQTVYNHSAMAFQGSASALESKAEAPSQVPAQAHSGSLKITTSSSGFFRAAQQEASSPTNNKNDKGGCHFPYFE